MVSLKEHAATARQKQETVSKEAKAKDCNITVFFCSHALADAEVLETENAQITGIKLACSSQLKDIYILKAFEAGADAVVVLTCPEGSCRYVEGNIRARKRVERTRKLLDATGLGGSRLTIHGIDHGDAGSANRAISEAIEGIRLIAA